MRALLIFLLLYVTNAAAAQTASSDADLRAEERALWISAALDLGSTIYAHRRIPQGTDYNPLVSVGSREEVIFMGAQAVAGTLILDYAGRQMRRQGSRRWRWVYRVAQVAHLAAAGHNVYVGVKFRTK